MFLKKTLHKKIKILIISILSTLALSSILQSNKYFIRAQQCIYYRLSSKVTIPARGWGSGNVITKDVTPKKDGLYNIYVLLEYDEKYPYHNIYLKCATVISKDKSSEAEVNTLFDKMITDGLIVQGTSIKKNEKINFETSIFLEEIIEYQLFDETTGLPTGMGIWNRKIIYMILKKNVQFYKKHSCKISLQHMMRNKFLQGIRSVKIYFGSS